MGHARRRKKQKKRALTIAKKLCKAMVDYNCNVGSLNPQKIFSGPKRKETA